MKRNTTLVVVKEFRNWQDEDSNGSVVLGYTSYLEKAKGAMLEDLEMERDYFEAMEYEIVSVTTTVRSALLTSYVGDIEYRIETVEEI